MSLALLMPGQGSQFVGMGKDLAERFPLAAETFREADDLLGFELSRLMFEGPEDELVQTRNAQPAILVHSVAVSRLVADEVSGATLAAGHSLGEFSAWVAAGSLGLRDALRLVRRRGELMFEAGTNRPGTMAAVLGLDDAMVAEVCRDASAGAERDVVVPANLNARGQVVVSGDVTAVQRASEALREAGARRVVPLSVSGAFHSALMKTAEEGLRVELESVKFGPARFPVVSNVTARPVRESSEAPELLVRQLTSPVRWAESVAVMTAEGVDSFLELGPGNVLSGLNRRNARGVATRSLGTADEIEAFLAEENS